MGMARKVDGVFLVSDEFVVNSYDFEGTADEVKACIDLAVDRARNMGMVGEGRFDITAQRGYYSDDFEIVMTYYFDRLETDKEKNEREELEAKLKADAAEKRKKAAEKRKLKKDAEFAEYERLKAKFAGM